MGARWGIGRVAAAILAAGLALCAGAVRADPLVVQVRLNGVDTGSVLQFEDVGGRIAAPRATLAVLGLRDDASTPPDAAGAIPLDALPSVTYRLDALTQTLSISAPVASLAAHDLARRGAAFEPPAPADWGAVLNYGVYAVAAQGQAAQASLISEARVFGPAGVLSTSFTLRHAPGDPNDGFRRLDTTYSWDDYPRARHLAVGDFITASLPWSTAWRAAGISYATDFSLRPDLVTEPLPQLRGASAVPSTVDLFVDGAKRATAQAPAGPFAIDATPMVDGLGRLTLVVTDALGRQSVQTMDFYAASDLLRKGASAFAFEGGALRRDYATDSDRYDGAFASAMARYGASDWMTLEGRAAASDRTQAIGGGIVAKAAEAALFSVAFSASNGRNGTGGQVYLSAKRDVGAYSLFASTRQSDRAYEEVGQSPGDIVMRGQTLVGGAVRAGRWGSVAATYSDLRSDRGAFRVANVSWSRGFGRFGLRASALKTFGDRDSAVVSLGLVAALGGGRAASAMASARASQATVAADVSQAPNPAGGWGWRLSGQGGSGGAPSDLEAEVRHDGDYGELGLGVSRFGDQDAARVYGSGALVWMGGRPRAAAQVGSGFALIETGEPGVAITVENRPIGVTGADGRLLAAQLTPDAASRIAIKPESVALDRVIEIQTVSVRPRRGSGVVARLPVRRAAEAVLLLTDASGAPLPVGLPVRLNGHDAGLTGFDGEAFVTGLTGLNILEVTDQSGECRLEIPYVHSDGAPARLGPFVCRMGPPDSLRDRSVRYADVSASDLELHGAAGDPGVRELRPGGDPEQRRGGLRGDEVHLHAAGLRGLWLHYRDRLRRFGLGHGPALAQNGPGVRRAEVQPLP